MPTFVQSHLATVDNTVSVAYPTANTAGNLLVVAVRYGADPGTLSDSKGNTYTQILSHSDGGGYTKAWFAPNCAAGANTLTLSNKAAIWILLEYSDVQTASVLDASNTGATTLTVTTTEANDLLVMIGGNVSGSVAPGQTGSYTQRQSHYQSYGGTPQSLTAWDTVAGAAGSYSNTLTNSTRGVLAAFKAAAVPVVGISPTSGEQDESVTVTVAGINTHFSGASVVTLSGSGVTVGSPVVASTTSLTVSLGISIIAATGPRTLTVTTGAEVVTATFTVEELPCPKRVRGSISPEQIQAQFRQGNSPVVLMASGEFIPGNALVTDACGNAVDFGAAPGGGGGAGTWADEVPAGTMNGSNTAFTISAAPIAGTLDLKLNGVRQEPTVDYSITGTAITYTTAPKSDDWHRAMYSY